MKKKFSKATTLCGMAVVASGLIIAGAVNNSNNTDSAKVFVPQETTVTKDDISLDMSFLDEAGVTVLEIGETNYLGGKYAELTGNDESAEKTQEEAAESESTSEESVSESVEDETVSDNEDNEEAEAAAEEKKPVVRNYVGTTVVSIADPFVFVREKPDAQSTAVGKFFKNAVGKVTAQTEDWYKIKSGNVEGYVKAEYVAAGSDAVEIYSKVVKYYVTVVPASLNIRKDAYATSSVIAKAKKDETYKVLETKDGWYKVSTGDTVGYIKSDYVQLKTATVKAKTLEEIKAEEKAKAEAEAKAKAEAEAKAKAEAEAKAKAEAAAKAKAEAAAKAKAEAAAKAKAEAAAKAKAKAEAEAKTLADDAAKSKTSSSKKSTDSKADTAVESEDSVYNATDLALLVALIHCEARWEPYEGKVALANIALNRVRSSRFPNTVYAVLHQRNQFTVVKKQVFKNTVKHYTENHSANMQETIRACKAALDGYNNVGTRVFYNGARWETRRRHNNPLQIGAHLFWDL